MNIKIVLTLGLFLCLPSTSFALMCPMNFNQIQPGNTMEQVLQQCGKPERQEEKNVPVEGPQEWSFFVPQTVASMNMTQVTGTLRSSFAFDKDGRIINISVNGIGVGSTQICNGMTISLGDTREMVRDSCGKPAYINREQVSDNNPDPKSHKVTTLFYNTSPVTRLIFIDNKFTERQQ